MLAGFGAPKARKARKPLPASGFNPFGADTA
jgi:hypothetical protein